MKEEKVSFKYEKQGPELLTKITPALGDVPRLVLFLVKFYFAEETISTKRSFCDRLGAANK